MIENIGELRPLGEQFQKRIVRRIRAIQRDLDAIPFQGGAGRLYVKELKCALEAGLLLASLHLAATLLELFVRELLIYHTAKKTDSPHEGVIGIIDGLEVHYEDATNPQWSFQRMVDELQSQGVVKGPEAESIKTYYQTIRIPIHHGLTRRFLRGHKQSSAKLDESDLLEILFFSRIGRGHELEDRLEGQGIDLIMSVIAFMKKHSRNLAA